MSMYTCMHACAAESSALGTSSSRQVTGLWLDPEPARPGKERTWAALSWFFCLGQNSPVERAVVQGCDFVACLVRKVVNEVPKNMENAMRTGHIVG